MEFSIKPIYSGEYDVIVVGGGIAGISAAALITTKNIPFETCF